MNRITLEGVTKWQWFSKIGCNLGRLWKRKTLVFKKNDGGGMLNAEHRRIYKRWSLAFKTMGRDTVDSGRGRNRFRGLLIAGHRVWKRTVGLYFNAPFPFNSPRPEDPCKSEHPPGYHTIALRGKALLVFMSWLQRESWKASSSPWEELFFLSEVLRSHLYELPGVPQIWLVFCSNRHPSFIRKEDF